ncbi:L,D-transpeptidase family protein [Patescibacteria group bacterium]|jgi:hypothetical protein|nr:L,D-transpeptidase family protein [Patescibacteria group bacterium]
MSAPAAERGITLPIVVILMVLTSLVTAAVLLAGDTSAGPAPTIEVEGPSGEREFLTVGPQPELANADFFDEVKEQFVSEGLTFVEVNLSTMELRLWERGLVVQSVPVLTKGRPGTWWETPPGLYQVNTKIREHVSSFAAVSMPYNLPFNGNFFIHGWPTYLDGTPVEGGFSGGCIRLSTEDAEALYRRVEVGTPILVFEDKFTSSDTAYTYRTPAPEASSVLVADLAANHVFHAREPDATHPLGSLLFPLVAVVASEHLSMESTLTAAPDPAGLLGAGETYELYELLFPLLLTGNEGALETIAARLGRERLTRLVAQKARSLGMVDTQINSLAVDDARNVTSAEDVFQLAKYVHSYRSFVLSMGSGELVESVYGGHPFPELDPALTGPSLDPSVREQLLVREVAFGEEPRPIAIIALGLPPGASIAAEAEAYTSYLGTFYRLVAAGADESTTQAGADPFVEAELPATSLSGSLSAYRAWIEANRTTLPEAPSARGVLD